MRISDKEIKKVLTMSAAVTESPETTVSDADQELVRQVTQDVIAMPSRSEMVDEVKARIQAGTYKPTGIEIADAMVRRAIADKVR